MNNLSTTRSRQQLFTFNLMPTSKEIRSTSLLYDPTNSCFKYPSSPSSTKHLNPSHSQIRVWKWWGKLLDIKGGAKEAGVGLKVPYIGCKPQKLGFLILAWTRRVQPLTRRVRLLNMCPTPAQTRRVPFCQLTLLPPELLILTLGCYK